MTFYATQSLESPWTSVLKRKGEQKGLYETQRSAEQCFMKRLQYNLKDI